MAKLPDLEKTRKKAGQVQKNLLMKVWIEAKTLEQHIVAEQNGALSCYLDVLQSNREMYKAANERNVDYTDT